MSVSTISTRSAFGLRRGAQALGSSFVVAAVLVSGLLGCSSPPSTDEVAAADSAEPELEPLQLTVFDCGRLRLDDVAMFGLTNDETPVRELFVPCYVVDHPNGSLLWDGGLPSATPSEWTEMEGGGATQMLAQSLSDQLEAMDRDMSFDFVAFSHMHFDHVGVANEVEAGTWLVQKPEHEAAFAESVELAAFEPTLYSGLADANTQLLEGDHDVFGDGRVRIISAPGHTPGHQVLFVDLDETGPVVLSGDLYHFRESREMGKVPVFNWDEDITRQSFARVDAFLQETGAKLWIEHELAFHEGLELAPHAYQ